MALLERQFSPMPLTHGAVCLEPGDLIQRVYFPTAGLISMVISTEKGGLVETGMVGREGAAGLQSALGQRFSFTRAIVQIPGTFYVTSTEALRRAVTASEEAKTLVQAHIEAAWAEAQQIAACNAAHEAAPRIARWLLQCADRTGTEQFMLTQEFLGEMLGIRRTRVTLLAQELQEQGLIRYSRGRITILNRSGLEARACDCYGVIKGMYQELLSRQQKQAGSGG